MNSILVLLNTLACGLVVVTLWSGLRRDPEPNEEIRVTMYGYLALGIINVCSPILF